MANLIKKSPYLLSIVSAAYLIGIMLGLVVFKQQVFIEQDIISATDIFIAAGFGLFVVFNICSIIIFRRNKLILMWGILSLVLLIGEKTMADEIARESLLGWETLGEWIILYVFLTIQLLFNLFVIKLQPS
jgi:hypothetical protein